MMQIALDKKKFIVGGVLILISLLYFLSISSPRKFPQGALVEVTEGAGLMEVAQNLKNKNIIRSPFWFRTMAIMLGGERGLKAGDYYLERRENSLKIAWRIVNGKRNIETIKVTIPEGFDKNEIAGLFDQRFPKFDDKSFLSEAKEGYLFPDTYFIEVSATASSTITLLTNNFRLKIKEYESEIASSTRDFDEVIKMASILEEEAQTSVDRQIVSGILWKRIKLNMPLQVDATLKYTTGRGSSELTMDDLKSNSPTINFFLSRAICIIQEDWREPLLF